MRHRRTATALAVCGALAPLVLTCPAAQASPASERGRTLSIADPKGDTRGDAEPGSRAQRAADLRRFVVSTKGRRVVVGARLTHLDLDADTVATYVTMTFFYRVPGALDEWVRMDFTSTTSGVSESVQGYRPRCAKADAVVIPARNKVSFSYPDHCLPRGTVITSVKVETTAYTYDSGGFAVGKALDAVTTRKKLRAS